MPKPPSSWQLILLIRIPLHTHTQTHPFASVSRSLFSLSIRSINPTTPLLLAWMAAISLAPICLIHLYVYTLCMCVHVHPCMHVWPCMCGSAQGWQRAWSPILPIKLIREWKHGYRAVIWALSSSDKTASFPQVLASQCCSGHSFSPLSYKSPHSKEHTPSTLFFWPWCQVRLHILGILCPSDAQVYCTAPNLLKLRNVCNRVAMETCPLRTTMHPNSPNQSPFVFAYWTVHNTISQWVSKLFVIYINHLIELKKLIIMKWFDL